MKRLEAREIGRVRPEQSDPVGRALHPARRVVERPCNVLPSHLHHGRSREGERAVRRGIRGAWQGQLDLGGGLVEPSGERENLCEPCTEPTGAAPRREAFPHSAHDLDDRLALPLAHRDDRTHRAGDHLREMEPELGSLALEPLQLCSRRVDRPEHRERPDVIARLSDRAASIADSLVELAPAEERRRVDWLAARECAVERGVAEPGENTGIAGRTRLALTTLEKRVGARELTEIRQLNRCARTRDRTCAPRGGVVRRCPLQLVDDCQRS